MVDQTAFSRDAKAYKVQRTASVPAISSAQPKVGRKRFGLSPRGVLLLLLSFAGLFGLGFLLFWGQIQHETALDVSRADGIVALTGGEARIPEAVKLLAKGKGQRLLISGVNPATTRKELAGLTPNSQHLFRCCIDVGRLARDTIGNADETGTWVRERRFKSLIVVTASYHMPRSIAELRRTLPDVELIPYPVQPRNVHVDAWWAYPGTLQLLLSEYVKFMPSYARCVGAQLGHRGALGAMRQCLASPRA